MRCVGAAEDWQTTLPAQEADLRARARKHREVADLLEAEASAIASTINASTPRPWLCDGHRGRLRGDPTLYGAWGDRGRLISDDPKAAIKRTIAAIKANPPSERRRSRPYPATSAANAASLRGPAYKENHGQIAQAAQARQPQPPPDTVVGDPPPVAPYPLRRGARAAVPDRTRMPDIGAACHETRRVTPAPSLTEQNRRGIETGTPRENVKTRQEHGRGYH